jgi:hypothetical protein
MERRRSAALLGENSRLIDLVGESSGFVGQTSAASVNKNSADLRRQRLRVGSLPMGE